MRGALLRNHTRRISCSIAAVVQSLNLSHAGNADHSSCLMLDAGLSIVMTSATFSTCSPLLSLLMQPIQGQVPEVGALEALNRSAGTGGPETVPPDELEEILWKQFFAETTQWWDNRRSKPTLRHPDFRHKESKVPLWLNSALKPAWVDLKIAAMEPGWKMSPETGPTSTQEPGASAGMGGSLEVAMCRKLCENGLIPEALDALDMLVQRGCPVSSNLFYRVLKRCIHNKDLASGKRIHALIVKSGYEGHAFLATHLIGLYASHGRLEEAMGVFATITVPDAYNWASIILAHARHGEGCEAAEAIRLYRRMCQSTTVKPSDRLYSAVLTACAAAKDLVAGKEVHAHIVATSRKPDIFVQAGLVNMYVKCGSLEDAKKLFDTLPDKNVVTWTAMIAGYAQQGMGQEAVNLYRCMQQEGLTRPNSVTYVCLLQACASIGIGALDKGKQLHAEIKEQGLQEGVVLGGSLVNMYAKCGSLHDARLVFDKLPERNLVAWNAMIAGYAQQGMGVDALSLYSRMKQEGMVPGSVTYVCLLQACAAVAALPVGELLHAEIEKRGMRVDAIVGAALVNMYAKCGSMFDSQRVFDALSERSIEAWNALIGGYARQGDSGVVFDLLDSMELEGIQPNEITFVSALTVCSHAGLVERGQEYFKTMTTDYGISATMEHYICMVDLLGRAGHLKEALQTARTMPFPPNDVVWRTLLGACRKWRNLEIGQEAFAGAVNADSKVAASYVLMSNIYAGTQMWEPAKEMQARRNKLGAWKKPGQSWWTDMGGVVHTFLAGDKKHPESDSIYSRLKQLVLQLTRVGYVPHLESSLLDLSDDEKQAELCEHSEKLAIAYALNKTTEGTTIRIVKNLRVCEDCHRATAYISEVEKRTIICRDASRFHVFKEGKCSCGDYW